MPTIPPLSHSVVLTLCEGGCRPLLSALSHLTKYVDTHIVVVLTPTTYGGDNRSTGKARNDMSSRHLYSLWWQASWRSEYHWGQRLGFWASSWDAAAAQKTFASLQNNRRSWHWVVHTRPALCLQGEQFGSSVFASRDPLVFEFSAGSCKSFCDHGIASIDWLPR